MNHEQGSTRKSQYLVPVIVFITVIVLGFLSRNLLQETIIISIQYGLWLGDFFIKVFGQRFLWILILVITLGMAFQFSRLVIPLPKNQRLPINDIEAPENRRIDFWLYRIFGYRQFRNGRNYFLLEFPRIIIDTLAFHQRKDPEEIKKAILDGDLTVPPEVRNIVGMDDLPPESNQDKKAFQGIRNLIRQIQGRMETQVLESDSDLEKVVTYLEDLLEDENGI